MNKELTSRIDRVAKETDFSGVVQIARDKDVLYRRVSGLADRAHNIPNTPSTQFAVASGTKALTALAVMSLVKDGKLELETRARDALGSAGSSLDPDITVRHLLAHTSGIGDYLDEDTIGDVEDYALDVPVHRLAEPRDFLPLLRGRLAKFPPGTRFSYCNSGYVYLAVLIEAASGRSYHDVVQAEVCAPAGMQATEFLRLDELPGTAAIGYLPKRSWRTNHLHLPVRGAGDGGAYSTVGDIARFWSALFTGCIVPRTLVNEMIRPQLDSPAEKLAYGLGFWLDRKRGAVQVEGCDPGISFRAAYQPETGVSYTVLANTTSGAWPVAREAQAVLVVT